MNIDKNLLTNDLRRLRSYVENGRKDDAKIGVKVEVAEGQKCERCWKYSTKVGEDKEHPTLCHRCAETIK